MKAFSAFLGELSSAKAQEWTEAVSVNGTVFKFKLGTCAAVSALPENAFNYNKLGNIQKAPKAPTLF